MKTIEIQLYKFDELSEAAKQTAIEKERNSEDYFFMEFFKDDAMEKINEAGFKGNVKLQYGLSYSQGDGLSFSCQYFDKMNDLFTEVLGPGKQKTIDCLINNISFDLKANNGHYCYASKSDIDLELDNYYVKSQNNIDLVINKVREKLEDLYIDLCRELEKQGYSEIEFQNSDECISENLINNDYDFTENGKMY
jgi:hypothetical protein